MLAAANKRHSPPVGEFSYLNPYALYFVQDCIRDGFPRIWMTMLQLVKIQVNGQIGWEVAKSQAGRWIGVCRALGLSMEGDTLDELYANINDSVQLLMKDLMEAGELDSFLQRRGWRREGTGPQQQGNVEFDVPIELIMRPRDSARTLLQ